MAIESKHRSSSDVGLCEKLTHLMPGILRVIYSHKMLMLGFVAGISAIIGFAISYSRFDEPGQTAGYFDRIFFKSFQIFILNAGLEPNDNIFLVIARISAVILFVRFACGVFFQLFGDAWEQLRIDLATGHTVLCGLGRVGRQWFEDLEVKEKSSSATLQHMPSWLARLLRQIAGPPIVGIEPCQLPIVQRIRASGNIVLDGEATDRRLLDRAGVLKAGRIVIATGKDATNLELLFELIDLVKSKTSSEEGSNEKRSVDRLTHLNLECHVHIIDPELADAISEKSESYPIKVSTFSAVRNGAQHLVARQLTEHKYRPCRDQTALYIIIGLGQCGTAVAMQIAELAHFSNLRRSRILFVERDCVAAADRLLSQCGALSPRTVEPDCSKVKFNDLADQWDQRNLHPDKMFETEAPGIEYICNAVFTERPQTISDERFLRMLEKSISDASVKPVVIVCDDEEQNGLETSLHLRQRFAARVDREVPVFVWMTRQEGLAKFLRMESSENRVIPFGRSKETVSVVKTLGLKTLKLAQKLHEDYCEKYSNGITSGKFAPWGSLAHEYRRSNISSAVHAWSKLAVFGIKQFSSNNVIPGYSAVGPLDPEKVELLAKMEHNRYVAERLRGGWRYAPTRDDAEREHPSLIPWEALTDDDKNKDREQVRKMFELLGASTVSNAKNLYWIPPTTELPPSDLDQTTEAIPSDNFFKESEEDGG